MRWIVFYQNGVWLHSMDSTEVAQGGLWVIGDQPYSPALNYPGRNDGSFLVKSWVAHPEKYGPGIYVLKDRLDDGYWEYVRVLAGCLECHVLDSLHDEGSKRRSLCFRLTYPDEGVEIPPIEFRSWCLPKDSSHARGVTICRKLPMHPIKPGHSLGYDYELAYWDDFLRKPLHMPLPVKPLNMVEWHYQYIEVIEGEVGFCREDSQGLSPYHLHASDHVFVPNDGKTLWNQERIFSPLFGRGVVIFF